MSELEIHADESGRLIRSPTFEGCLQRVMLESYRECIQAKRYAPIARHPGERRLYGTIQKKLFCLHVAIQVFQTVSNSATCTRIREGLKRNRHLKCFPASWSLDFIARNIPSALPRLENGNVVYVKTHWYLKMNRAIITWGRTATHDLSLSLDHQILPYGVLDHVLTFNSSQIVSKFIIRLYVLLGLRHLRAAAYHPATKRQVGSYIEMIVAGL